MTPEKIKELREMVKDGGWVGAPGWVNECLDEIDRLRAVLIKISSDAEYTVDTHPPYRSSTAAELAREALKGTE